MFCIFFISEWQVFSDAHATFHGSDEADDDVSQESEYVEAPCALYGSQGRKKKTEKKKERRGARDVEERNRTKAILALAKIGRSLDSLPKDLAAAIGARRIPGAIVSRYFELEKSGVFRWLLQFGGFKERLLADDLFLTKVAIE